MISVEALGGTTHVLADAFVQLTDRLAPTTPFSQRYHTMPGAAPGIVYEAPPGEEKTSGGG